MRKREQGILTVEASIVLTLMTLFTLFLFSFIRIYRAENMVSHATLQAADAMALESYLRENALDDKADDVVYLANRLTGASTLNVENFESLRSANVPAIAKEKFIAAVSNSEANANTILTNYGVKGGLSGIDFSTSTIDLDRDDVIVNVSYTLKLQFPIFGASEISVTKSAKAKTFGEILFEIIAEPDDPNKGSTSGSGNYQHGSTIQITANPNYGYKFVKWNDGNTENPRIVPVTEAHKYIAIFEADSFGIITLVSPAGTGTATGEGTYTYLSTANLDATANPGYHFDKWSVYKHKDGTTMPVTSQSVSQTVDQSYTYTANFVPNVYTLEVRTEPKDVSIAQVAANGYAMDLYYNNPTTKVNVTYGEWYSLHVAHKTNGKYEFVGWRIEGETNILSRELAVSRNTFNFTNNVTIIACYKVVTYDVNVTSAGNGTVTGGNTYDKDTSVTIKATPNDGYEFDYWDVNGVKNTSIGASYTFTVTSDMTFVAHFKKKVQPSISIEIATGSAVGKHSIILYARTVPEDAAVSWIDCGYGKYSISSVSGHEGDSHWIKLTLNDSNLNYNEFDPTISPDDFLNNRGKKVGNRIAYEQLDVDIRAKLRDYDKTSSKTVTIRPSTTVQYAKYDDSNDFRNYYYRWSESTEQDYKETNQWFRRWQVPYSQLSKAKTISPGDKYTSEEAKKNDGSKQQSGINKEESIGYVLPYPKSLGSWGAHVIAFLVENKGEQKPGSSEYYDYYIFSVK